MAGLGRATRVRGAARRRGAGAHGCGGRWATQQAVAWRTATLQGSRRLHEMLRQPTEHGVTWVRSPAPFGVLALAQTVVLWQHVHGAWTWVLANLVGGIVMFSLIAAGAFTWALSPLWMILIVLGLAAAPAIVTGFAMVWLINMNWRRSDF